MRKRTIFGKKLRKAKRDYQKSERRDRQKEVYNLGDVCGGSRWWSDKNYPNGWGIHTKMRRRMRSLIRLWKLEKLPSPRIRELLCNSFPVSNCQ